MDRSHRDETWVSLRVPAELERAISELAARCERTRSGQIRHLIRTAVQQDQQRQTTEVLDAARR